MDVNAKVSANSIAPAASRAAVQPSVPLDDELRRRILVRIVELSRPVPPPALWLRFGSSTFVRRLSCPPRELFSQLAQQFTPDELLARRVATRTKTGEPEIATALATDQAFLIRGDATGLRCQ